MKLFFKILLVISFSSYFENGVNAQKNFTLYGTIPKKYDGVKISLSSNNSEFRKLTTNVKNGQFKLTGKIDNEYERIILSVFKDQNRLGLWIFFITNGEMKIDILGFEETQITKNVNFYNIPFVNEQKKYKSLIVPLVDSQKIISSLIQSVNYNNGNKYDKDSLMEILRDLNKRLAYQKIEFIRKNPKSYYSLYILDSEIINLGLNILYVELDTLSNLFSMLDISVKNTHLGKSVESYLLKRKSLLVNQIMPNFSFFATDGKQYDLSSFRNEKYVLLCFWDSWCLPCVKSIPVLKKIDSSYSGKGLQLISLSIDSDEKKWQNSLKKYEMPWLQSCDLLPYITTTPLKDLYDVKYIPQYFLIDKAGKLIYHNSQLNDDDEFNILRNMLENLFDY